VGKDYHISHPGHAQDVTNSPGPSAAECQALVRSQGAAEAFNETEWVDSMYNPGEERLNISFACAPSTTSLLGLAWVALPDTKMASAFWAFIYARGFLLLSLPQLLLLCFPIQHMIIFTLCMSLDKGRGFDNMKYR
jgi:hypothetical protein